MSYYSTANPDLVRFADVTARVVVELGCGTGATSALLRLSNPTARFVGIELLAEPAAQARAVFDTVIEGNIELPETFADLDRTLGPDRIDLLIIGDVLEHLTDPWTVMRQLHQRMSDKGRLVLSLPNVSHWSLIRQQLRGDWTYRASGLLDRTHLRFFTRKTGRDLLEQAGWQVNASHPREFEKPQSRKVIDALASLAPVLNIPVKQLRQDVSALQWVHCAAARPRARPYRIHANGIATALDSLTTLRLAQPLNVLQGMGRATHVLRRGNFALPGQDEPPGILLTYRIHPDGDQWQELERLIERGWLFIHDVDDHPAYLKAQKRLDFRSIRLAHAITVSTPALAECCRQWNDNVHLVQNRILSLAPRHEALAQNDDPTVFLGAVNREDQWGTGVRPAVVAALQSGGFRTTILTDRSFAADLGDTATLLPIQRYDRYRTLLAQADIALLPLLANEFTACKSDLKIIECLASGTVPLCSAYAASRTDVPAHLVLAADGPDDWVRQLNLLKDKSFRAQMQAAGYDWVGRNRMWSGGGEQLDALYSRLLANRPALDADRRNRMRRLA